MTSLLLIDLDGTAREILSGQICPTYAKDQKLRLQFANQCDLLKKKGWVIVAVTNQGGCEAINPDTGKPYKTRRQAVAECKYFLDLASWCDRAYMCPNKKGSDCDEVYRISRSYWWPWPKYWVTHEYNNEHPYYQTRGYCKPNPGMLELAAKDQEEKEWSQARELGIRERDMAEIKINALMIGNMNTDRLAADSIKISYLDVKNFEAKSVENLTSLAKASQI